MSPRSSAMSVVIYSLLATACSDDGGSLTGTGGTAGTGGANSTSGTPVELVSHWTNEADAAALQVLIDAYKDEVPGGSVTNLAEDWTTARAIITDGIASEDDAPDVVHGFAVDLPGWLAYAGDPNRNVLAPLEDAIGNSLSGFAPAVIDMVSHDGSVYALPTAGCRANTLYYNQRVFDDNSKQAPQTFEEFLVLAAEMRDLGKPFAVSVPNHGSKEFFNWMATAVKGATWFENFINGRLDWEDDELAVALDQILDQAIEVLDLGTYVGIDQEEVQDAEAALDMLKDGEISMFVYPDWMKSWLTGQGLTPGVDFGMMMPPLPAGADTIYIYAFDMLMVPKGARHLENALKFIETASTAETIQALVDAKQANSPRIDLDPDTMDPVAAQSMSEMASATILSSPISESSALYHNIFAPADPEATIDDFAMIRFVTGYKDGDCAAADCKATFIAKFEAAWPGVAEVAVKE